MPSPEYDISTTAVRSFPLGLVLDREIPRRSTSVGPLIKSRIKVRFGSDIGHKSGGPPCPLCANNCREQVQQKSALEGPPHSITSSARTRSEGGTLRPSALAVFRLITISNLVGCSIGRSAGFVPLRILST